MAAVHRGLNTLCCALAAGRLWEMFKCTINDCINQPRSLTLSWFGFGGCRASGRMHQWYFCLPWHRRRMLIHQCSHFTRSEICKPFCEEINGVVLQVGNVTFLLDFRLQWPIHIWYIELYMCRWRYIYVYIRSGPQGWLHRLDLRSLDIFGDI